MDHCLLIASKLLADKLLASKPPAGKRFAIKPIYREASVF